MDVRAATGVETYVNDEPNDPNPGIIVDSTANHGRALTSAQARALAVELLQRADYLDELYRIEVKVTTSAGVDGAIVVFIDTEFEPDGSDGGPGLRVNINDHDTYVGVAYQHADEGNPT